MYIIGILLACVMSLIIGPLDIIASFGQNHVALAVMQIIITALLFATAILIFLIREYRGNFELDIVDEDGPITINLKNAAGYCLAGAVILLIITWFCRLGNII